MQNFTEGLQKIDAWNFLQDNSAGTLASINESGAIELSTVYFFAKSDFACYFVTKAGTRKYKNFMQNQTAALLTFNEEKRISAEVQGSIESVTDVVKVAQIIELFQELVTSKKVEYWIPPLAQISAGEYVVCKLVPKLVHYNDFGTEPTGHPKQLTFYPVA